MRLDIILRGMDQAAMAECARAADRPGAGLTLWLPESPGDRSAFVTAAALLAQTRATRIATGVTPIPLRAPIDLLTAAMTLAEAFPGRFDLGVGSGNVGSLGAAGVPAVGPPLRVTGQFLDAAGTLDERTGLAALIDVPPSVSRPPVYLAAHNRRMIDLAVSRADGVILNMVAASDLPGTSAYVAACAQQTGRVPAVVMFQLACLDGDEAVTAARRVLSGFLRSPLVRRRLRSFGSGHADMADRLAAGPKVLSDKELERAVPDDVVADFAVLSEPALRERVAVAAANGVTALSLSIFPVPLVLRKAFPPVPEGNSALAATLAAIDIADGLGDSRGPLLTAGVGSA